MSLGSLVIGKIDLNSSDVATRLKVAVQRVINRPASYHAVRFKPQYYFEVPDGLPSDRGWYILLLERAPIYVGKADNLDSRLNTNNGTIDNFANQRRTSDSQRNFIKKFDELGLCRDLRVCIIREEELVSILSADLRDIDDVDRGNIEKFINILRCTFVYQEQDDGKLQ